MPGSAHVEVQRLTKVTDLFAAVEDGDPARRVGEEIHCRLTRERWQRRQLRVRSIVGGQRQLGLPERGLFR
jgi:hypothetical protein